MILLALTLAALAGDEPGTEDAWQFVVPAAGDPFEHPPLHALALSGTRPEDVVEKVGYRGARRRYAQLRYGSPGSVRVTVVVDEIGPGAADLYVDADRNRRIEARDRVEGPGRIWRLPLDVATVEGKATHQTRRAVVLRLGASGRTLSVAAAGYLEGTVVLDGQRLHARRTDGDADGTYTGPQDRLWIDRDDDGRFDPLTEQFLFAAILTIGPERYAARSDPQGQRLTLEPLRGTGAVRLAIGRTETRDRLTAIHVLLIGRDGSALGMEGAGATIDAPVGEYRVSALSLSLTDPAGGPPWHFVFSDSLAVGHPVWFKIEAGRTLDLDPIGPLDLSAEVQEPPAERARGGPLTVQPRLYTAHGLLINSGFRGAPAAPGLDHATTTRISLRSADGETLDATTSGFS
jgi:hypothetical protein